MLKEAIEKIVSLAAPTTFEVDGKTFSSQELVEVRPREYHTERIAVTGLDSVCKLVRNEADQIGRKIFIRVADYATVSVFSTYDNKYRREALYRCDADTPNISFGAFMDHQEAIIQLQSLYIPNEDTKYLLKLLSSISQESNVTSKDNGVTQVVEAKTGIALKQNVEVKPIVNLQPFRTFLEVEQPESSFLLRVNEGGMVALIPADGGVWKLEATRNIAAYFEDKLKDMIEAGTVVVIR